MVRIKETLNIGPIKVFLEYSFSFASSSVWFFGSDYEFLFGFQTGDSNLISISVLTNKKKVQNLGSDGSLVVNQTLAISNCWEKKVNSNIEICIKSQVCVFETPVFNFQFPTPTNPMFHFSGFQISDPKKAIFWFTLISPVKWAAQFKAYLPTRSFCKYDPIWMIICSLNELNTCVVLPVPHGL